MKTGPYTFPRNLEPDLAQVLAYWEGLKRGDAGMPFWDDVNLSALPNLSKRLMLIEVFDKPLRFRLGLIRMGFKRRSLAAVGRGPSASANLIATDSELAPLHREGKHDEHHHPQRAEPLDHHCRRKGIMASPTSSGNSS